MKFANIMAAGILSIMAGCPGQNISPRHTEVSPIIWQNKAPLYVNETPNFIRTDRSRALGEKDLLRMAREAEMEEAWYYARYADGKEIWQECGYDQSMSSSRIETSLVDYLVKDNLEELSFYHFHPVKKNSNKSYDFSQVPSENDFYMCRNLLHRISNVDATKMHEFDCRVAVSTGIYTITVSPDIILEKKQLDFNTNIARIKNVMSNAELGLNKRLRYFKKNRDNFSEMNKHFAEKLSSRLIKIEFEER